MGIVTSESSLMANLGWMVDVHHNDSLPVVSMQTGKLLLLCWGWLVTQTSNEMLADGVQEAWAIMLIRTDRVRFCFPLLYHLVFFESHVISPSNSWPSNNNFETVSLR